MFDSSKDYFLIENCKIFLSIIVNYHFCHTRFALIGGHVGHVGYNCHALFFKNGPKVFHLVYRVIYRSI